MRHVMAELEPHRAEIEEAIRNGMTQIRIGTRV